MEIAQIIAITASLIILIFVFELIRRNMLKEKYALLWLCSSLILLVLSIWKKMLDIAASFFGFYYAPSFLFLVAVGFLIVIIFHFSIVISRLSEENKKLAQEISIIKEKVEQINSKETKVGE